MTQSNRPFVEAAGCFTEARLAPPDRGGGGSVKGHPAETMAHVERKPAVRLEDEADIYL